VRVSEAGRGCTHVRLAGLVGGVTAVGRRIVDFLEATAVCDSCSAIAAVACIAALQRLQLGFLQRERSSVVVRVPFWRHSGGG
jgi:hypothetical protein